MISPDDGYLLCLRQLLNSIAAVALVLPTSKIWEMIRLQPPQDPRPTMMIILAKPAGREIKELAAEFNQLLSHDGYK